MKYIAIAAALFLSACVQPHMGADLAAHLEAERDFAAQVYQEDAIYEKYDPEYIDDCLRYEELVCPFE